MRVALIGATSKTGRQLLPRLIADGHAVRALGRDARRLRERPEVAAGAAESAVADLTVPADLAAALEGCEVVVSLAHARHVAALLDALPPGVRRVVVTGSTRAFTHLPDAAADAVRAGAAAFAARCNRPGGPEGVLLHPSMIFGAPGDRNVNRVLHLLRRWPRGWPALVPLPDGGRHLVQPVFVDDAVAAFAAAVTAARAPGAPIVLAGPVPLRYREMVGHCALALGRRLVVVPVPTGPAAALADAVARLGLTLPVRGDELRRMAEDKAFDAAPLRDRLGIEPLPFAEGLRRRLARGW